MLDSCNAIIPVCWLWIPSGMFWEAIVWLVMLLFAALRSAMPVRIRASKFVTSDLNASSLAKNIGSSNIGLKIKYKESDKDRVIPGEKDSAIKETNRLNGNTPNNVTNIIKICRRKKDLNFKCMPYSI